MVPIVRDPGTTLPEMIYLFLRTSININFQTHRSAFSGALKCYSACLSVNKLCNYDLQAQYNIFSVLFFCLKTKTGVCLLQDGNQEPFRVRLHLARDILMIQEQDVICVSGEPFYSGVSRSSFW